MPSLSSKAFFALLLLLASSFQSAYSIPVVRTDPKAISAQRVEDRAQTHDVKAARIDIQIHSEHIHDGYNDLKARADGAQGGDDPNEKGEKKSYKLNVNNRFAETHKPEDGFSMMPVNIQPPPPPPPQSQSHLGEGTTSSHGSNPVSQSQSTQDFQNTRPTGTTSQGPLGFGPHPIRRPKQFRQTRSAQTSNNQDSRALLALLPFQQAHPATHPPQHRSGGHQGGGPSTSHQAPPLALGDSFPGPKYPFPGLPPKDLLLAPLRGFSTPDTNRLTPLQSDPLFASAIRRPLPHQGGGSVVSSTPHSAKSGYSSASSSAQPHSGGSSSSQGHTMDNAGPAIHLSSNSRNAIPSLPHRTTQQREPLHPQSQVGHPEQSNRAPPRSNRVPARPSTPKGARKSKIPKASSPPPRRNRSPPASLQKSAPGQKPRQ